MNYRALWTSRRCHYSRVSGASTVTAAASIAQPRCDYKAGPCARCLIADRYQRTPPLRARTDDPYNCTVFIVIVSALILRLSYGCTARRLTHIYNDVRRTHASTFAATVAAEERCAVGLICWKFERTRFHTHQIAEVMKSWSHSYWHHTIARVISC